jgi:SNF2 family DNA or RNA helicase
MNDYCRSSKINAIMNKIDPIIKAREKVVIFTIFLGMMDLLEHEFGISGYKHLRFDGSTS